MACDVRLAPQQTQAERTREVREGIERLAKLIQLGKVKAIVDRKTRALAFLGWEDRRGISDACVYRLAKRNGDTRILKAIEMAEAQAGVRVSKQAVNAGVHTHDNGRTWHKGH